MQQRRSEENALQQKLKDAASRFLGQYAQWEQNYILRNPYRRQGDLFPILEREPICTGRRSAFDGNAATQDYVARGRIGMDRSGKIEAGQQVLVKLAAYPFEEYGMLREKVISRSAVAMDSTFLIEIKLDQAP